jgi:hypothetical protein
VVAPAKATMERRKDYRKALLCGMHYREPETQAVQYHFMNKANTSEAEFHSDPSKLTSCSTGGLRNWNRSWRELDRAAAEIRRPS